VVAERGVSEDVLCVSIICFVLDACGGGDDRRIEHTNLMLDEPRAYDIREAIIFPLLASL